MGRFFQKLGNTIGRFILFITKSINGLFLLLAFGLIFAFIIKNWGINVADPYVIIGCFLLLIAIPIVSRFNVFQYKDIILKRSVDADITKASSAEIKREKEQEQVIEKQSKSSSSISEGKKRFDERRKTEQKALKRYVTQNAFEKEVKLLLDQNDPIADIEYLLFDGSYRDRKRRYFIVVKSTLSPMLMDRIYRNLRIIKDVSDRIYHNRIILKFVYVQTDENKFMSIDRFRNYFRNAIENGYLEIEMFDKDGNKL